MKIYKLLLFVSISFSLHALSLEEAIDTTLKNSLEIKKLSLDIDLAKENSKEKKSSRFGRVDLAASYTHYNLPRTLTPLTPASIGSGANDIPTTKDMMIAGVSYNVDIFTGMDDTRSIEIANLQKEMSSSLYLISTEQLVYNVKVLYLNILATKAKIDAQKKYVTALTKLYEDIKFKVELGNLSKIDALKSSADLNRAKADLAKLISAKEILKGTLATTMYVDSISDLEDTKINVLSVDTKSSTYETQLMHTKRVQLTKQNIQKSIKQEQKSLSMYYPKITFNAYYGQNSGYNDDTNFYSGDFQSAEVWQAGVDLKWNILDFGKTSALSQKSKILTMQARLDESKTKRELKRSLDEALSKITLAISNYQSSISEVSLMKETQKIEQIRYDNGASDINDLLYAKARYLLAEGGLINARYEYKNSIYYLDYLLEQGNKK